MKHKTLFRLIIKAIGVFFVLWAAPSLLRTLINYSWGAFQRGIFTISWWPFILELAPSLLQLSAGLYLFFDGSWVVNRSIPSNRPYCPNCAYDLSHASTPKCPECGVKIEKTELDILS